VPYRGDGGRRDQLWGFTRSWLELNHPDWEIIEGNSPNGPFNRGAAVNEAARQAGDWDVAVIHDADNIADPEVLVQAVERAHRGERCVFPFETYLYLNEYSTNRLIEDGSWFVTPIEQRWGVMREHEHYSGVQAISRVAYDLVGGFPELEGWGSEDVIMGVMLKVFTNGVEYLQGSALHLYHGEGHEGPERQKYGEINREIQADVMGLSVMPEQLREYLRAHGHPIPPRQ
jgi:hypothetical protein